MFGGRFRRRRRLSLSGVEPHAAQRLAKFLILHVADHTDTTAQAHQMWSELLEAGVPAKIFGVAGTDHVRLDRDLGIPGDPSTSELFAFVEDALKKMTAR